MLAFTAGALLPLVGTMRGGAMVLRRPDSGIVIEIPFAVGIEPLVVTLLLLAAAACVVVRRSRTPRRATVYAVLAAVVIVRLYVSVAIGTARFLVFDADHAAWPVWAAGGSLSLGPAYYGAVLSVTLGAIGVVTAWAGRRSRPGVA
jgi:hypothetical protein